MNKRRFVSFAALAALLCVPCVAALPMERTAILANSTINSADQFIDQYCGAYVTTIAADGSNVSQFAWYSQVDVYNAPILVESYTVFGQLSPSVQQTIVAACLAHNIDYYSFVAQAQAFLAPAPVYEVPTPVETAPQEPSEAPANSGPVGVLPEESSSSNVKQDPKASSPDSTNSSTASSLTSSQDSTTSLATSSTSQTSQTPTEVDTPPAPVATTQEPTSSQNPTSDSTASGSTSNTSSQASADAIVPGQPTTLENYDPSQVDSQVIFNGTTLAQGLTFEDYTDAFDANTQQVIYALAAKSGLSTFEAHEVVYVYQKDGVRSVSDPVIKLSGGGPVVLFQILNYTDKGANVLFFTDDNCSYDATNNRLALAPAGILFVEASGLETKELAQATDEASKAPLNDQSVSQPTSEAVQSQGGTSSSITSSTLSTSTAPTSSSTSSATQPDAQATQFLNRYCYQSGMLIRQASQSNYRQLLNAINDWLNLSANSKAAVNSFLTSMGSQTFQTLYTQANRIRLGLPITQVPAGNETSSVNTAVWQDPNLWLSGLLLSSQGMLYLSNRRRLGVRFEKIKG